MKDQRNLDMPGEMPDWFQAVLAHGQTSEAFRESCEEAALAGLTMVRLRKVRETVGFQPKPFDRYVEHLAEVASATLDGLCAYYGASTIDLRTSLHVAARFARDLGLPKGESKVLLKYIVAEDAGALPHPASLLARGGAAPLRKYRLQDCERQLEEFVKGLPAGAASRFSEVDRLVDEMYLC